MKKRGLSLKQKNQLAQKSDDELAKWRRIGSISYLYQGKILKKIKENNLYKYLGKSPEFENFEMYVNSRGIDLRKAYYLIQIYSVFVEEYKYKPEELSDTHWTSLRSLLPVVNKKNVKELVEKAKILTRSHLDQEIKSLKAGLTSMEDLGKHIHTWKFISYYRCTICGERSLTKPKDGKIL